jgi:hypothetical protein
MCSRYALVEDPRNRQVQTYHLFGDVAMASSTKLGTKERPEGILATLGYGGDMRMLPLLL